MSSSSCWFGNAIVRVKKPESGSASPARWRRQSRGSCRVFEGHQLASAAGSPGGRDFPGQQSNLYWLRSGRNEPLDKPRCRGRSMIASSSSRGAASCITSAATSLNASSDSSDAALFRKVSEERVPRELANKARIESAQGVPNAVVDSSKWRRLGRSVESTPRPSRGRRQSLRVCASVLHQRPAGGNQRDSPHSASRSVRCSTRGSARRMVKVSTASALRNVSFRIDVGNTLAWVVATS